MLKFSGINKKRQPVRHEKKPKEKPEEKLELEGVPLTSENIKNQIGGSDDVIIHPILVNGDKGLPVTLVFIDGIIDSKSLDDDVLKPLLQEGMLSKPKSEKEIIEKIVNGAIYHNAATIRCKIDECIEDIINCSAALIFDKEQKAVTFKIKSFEKRAVTEPSSENVFKGSKEGFIESLRVNTSLVRRKIKTQNLRIKETIVGVQTVTDVAVVYIEGLTNKHIVDEVIKRINSIDRDGVLLAGDIEEYIIDNKHNAFPQLLYTERSDRFCRNILDGRVGILIDGMPVAYIVPATINMFLRAPEDDANNFIIASFIRLIRYGSYLGTLLIPGLYIAITTFHQEMIPTNLALSIIKSKVGVPFPAFAEVAFMLIAFELLMEAGLRLPKTVGQSVSIVGAVVVGQAAVAAKLLSPAVIVVIAVTGIAGFTIPNQDFSVSIRLWRMMLVIFSIVGGLFGVVMGLLLMGYRLAQMENFGVPYLAPFVGTEGKWLLKDTIIRPPLPTMKSRPGELKTKNKRRQK